MGPGGWGWVCCKIYRPTDWFYRNYNYYTDQSVGYVVVAQACLVAVIGAAGKEARSASEAWGADMAMTEAVCDVYNE